MESHTSTPMFQADPLVEAETEDLDPVLSAARDSLRRLEHELSEVERAVRRLEEGSYGKCDICSVEVAADVLAGDPTAHRCASHQEHIS